MKKDLTIRDKAKQLEQKLIIKTRDDGSNYICIDGLAGKDYPEWMQDVCMAGHLDTLPNDESYKAISSIISSIVELDDDITDADDILEELRDGGCLEPDCYMSSLTGWLHSNNSYMIYLDDAMQEYNPIDGCQLLATAQGIWLDETAAAVVRALEEA
jgi:hypothetical protein